MTAAPAAAQSADDAVQAAAYRAAARDPRQLDDKLFILWEYAGALREQALARIVLKATNDPEIKALATMVIDGHQLGMDIMRPIAAELGVVLPQQPTAIDLAAIEAAGALPPDALELFFLRRQRAMHAWDITVFDDYLSAARNKGLKRYVAATRAPLREHAEWVNRVAAKRGIEGGLTVFGAGGR
ncbi:DUF4142 domain-containing protein [Reyranella sp. CPCC 100927]|uniref:DUF4142 domain-containing protein n=1 Tax=Reyranella sp. CPCC 100927 TaxID=2599616 RepID=UPI0015B7162D|nr:DUF4142 domain-containing protein [Reyranella sp. CPCC 100927]